MKMNGSSLFILISLIVAGELIFSLPFHIPRFFRPTLLEALQITNTQLGDAFAIYGLCAMLAYFPGGAIADRIAPKLLLIISLLATALGGIFLATLPSGIELKILFAYWGVTTIFLFWGAMIKATRLLGENNFQGRAFGLLDGGRGFVAAACSSAAIFLFAKSAPALFSEGDAKHSLRAFSYFYSVLTVFAAGLIWFSMKHHMHATRLSKLTLAEILISLKSLKVWLIGCIVISAYCGYKSLDNISLYAIDVLGMPRQDAEQYATTLAYLRPVAAITAGLLADYFRINRIIQAFFIALLLASLFLGFHSPSTISAYGEDAYYFISLTSLNITVSFWAVYALRGIYFAQIQASGIPAQQTGIAVGIVSVIGFMPDIFFAPVTGRMLDANPGLIGHQHAYLFLAVIACIGLIASIFLKHLTTNK